MSRTQRTLFVIIVLSVSFVGSCSPQAADFPATQSIETLPASISTASASPVPTAYVQKDSAVDSSLFLFSSFHMESEMTGWATADPPDNQSEGTWHTHILRTTNGGIDWLDVLPRSEITFTPHNMALFDGEKTLFAGDSGDPAAYSINIWHTYNGGETWETGTPLSFQIPPMTYSIKFTDDQHGSLDVVTDVAMGTAWIRPFTTSDGGIHWDELAAYTKSTASNSPYNVGVNPSDCGLYEDSHTFFSALEGIFQIRCDSDLLIYHTQDGGVNWDIPAKLTGFSITTFVNFVDVNNGWRLATEDTPANLKGRALYVTHDGGKTWEEILPVIDPGSAKDSIPISSENPLELIKDFQFIDSKTGWATLEIFDSFNYSLLMKTNDGGFTWNYWTPHWHGSTP